MAEESSVFECTLRALPMNRDILQITVGDMTGHNLGQLKVKASTLARDFERMIADRSHSQPEAQVVITVAGRRICGKLQVSRWLRTEDTVKAAKITVPEHHDGMRNATCVNHVGKSTMVILTASR